MTANDEDVATALHTLHGVTREMMRADEEATVLEIATDAVSELLGFEYNTIRRHERDPERLVPVASSTQLRAAAGEREPYAPGETVQFDALEQGELVTSPDLREVDDEVARTGEGSMIVVPLEGYGVLTLGTTTRRAIDPRDTELARVFGANVETALERVHRLATLREREAELAEQNERLDTLVSKAAHELRNPLNVLMGRIELARQTGDPTHLEDLACSVARMDQLIDDTLTLARAGTLSVSTEPVELCSRAQECWETIRTREATLETELPADASLVADPDRLEQVLGNLFRNAVEHGGRSVTVTVGRLPESGVSNGDDRSDAGFYIADDGEGIDHDHSEQLLEPGVAEPVHWTGVGLGIVSQMADLHGWSVWLTESDAGGVRVEFRGVEWQ